MANTTVKRQYTKLVNDNNDLEIEHFETDADIVLVDNSTGHYGGSATDAQAALEEIYDIHICESIFKMLRMMTIYFIVMR